MKIWSVNETVARDNDYQEYFVLYFEFEGRTVHVAYTSDMLTKNRTKTVEVLQAGIKQLCHELIPEPTLEETIRDKIAELKKEISVLENIIKHSGDEK
jgi:hypothetical protein